LLCPAGSAAVLDDEEAALQGLDLSAIPLFADLSREELAQLNRMAHPISYKAGEQIFKEGEAAIGVYLVTSGVFELRHDVPGGPSQVETTINPGGIFGLTSVLDEGPRRASAYAKTDGTCLTLSRITFREAILQNPGIALHVLSTMAKNMRELSSLVARD
jgi:CRP/FNR family transcriptional regulator